MEIKSYFKKIIRKFTICKYNKECPYFDENSPSCFSSHDFYNNYCGKYSEFDKLKKTQIKNERIN